MMPKILNYGFSRVFNEEIRRTVLKNINGSLAYMATPEYLANGEITFKSDIYSLGLTIMQIVTGQNKNNYSNIASIVESWRSRLELETLKGGNTFETCYQQVLVCIEIGIRCMDNDPGNRPIPRYIIDRLWKTEMEQSDRSDISISPELGATSSAGIKRVMMSGVNSLACDSEKSMLTVVGDVDVVEVLMALGEKHPAQVITVGSAEKVECQRYYLCNDSPGTCTIM
ncbi:hypothetical protein ACQJBY_056254 [Aegilops geniculata]